MSASSLGDPQSLNLYAYCGNDPINHTDPDGLFFKKLFGGLRKFLSNIFVRIALVVALAIITIGASSSLWALTYKTLVEVQLGGHAIGTTATVISIEVTKLTTLGWIAAGLGAVTGASLGIREAGFRTPPTFETGLLATQPRSGGTRGGRKGSGGGGKPPYTNTTPWARHTAWARLFRQILYPIRRPTYPRQFLDPTKGGFGSFQEFKNFVGESIQYRGKTYEWHHIVEQNPNNLRRFRSESINHIDNLIRRCPNPS
jgi:hypothetical protein